MPLFELADTGDAVGAGANMDAASRQRFHKAGGLARHFHDGGIVGQHGKDRVAVSGRRLDRVERFRAEPDQRFELFRSAVVDAKLMTAIEQTARHGLAHAAEPDKSRFHFVSPGPYSIN